MLTAEMASNLRLQLQRTLQGDIDICRLNDKGLAHWHFRLKGTGLLARIPKQSQMGLGPLGNLAYEAACFQRAAACGHVPRLDRVIPPSEELPWGALLVEEITGSPVVGPDHMAPILQALASIHVLPVPTASERAPLLSESDPLYGMLRLVLAQSVYLDHPLISEPSRRTITKRLNDLTVTAPQICDGLAPRLITFDAHPGNFLITPTGKAVLVDLEKLRYSYPPLDLAHATLYTSTTWDVDASFTLSTAQVAHAYGVWMSAAGTIAEPYLAAFVPLRELMWLWSVTWCAKWLTESVKTKHASGAGGEDWSQANSDALLIQHVRSRVDDYLSISTINQVLSEFNELDRLFAHSS
ncbi:phosphotransferase [Rhodoferax sp.]|uniref:phosphotransferase n=1 Tax=Rhodoferax sp. TaxID=50421 RepID=UPI00272F3CA7|nr:phosphotransferase [Rhodoferax sp.]MDP2440112.1 phosphotransferase [Rhodoferax sp.]